MKKIVLILAVVVLAICVAFALFYKFGNVEKPEAEVEVLTPISFETTISSDKEYVALNYGEEYRWYETTAVLNNFLDEECDGSIESVGSVFQVTTEEDETSMDTEVILTSHTEASNDYIVKHGFYVGDRNLCHAPIILKFEDAFAKVMESDFPKPHSRYCVLRQEVGAKEANPQYIFGNENYALFVDAVSGEVTDQNPAY
jgi:hypothetical protein